jgi:hypothetical protein
MLTKVFVVFAPHHRTAGFLTLSARCALIAVLFAATPCPTLLGQMAGMRASPGRSGAATQLRGHAPAGSGSGGVRFRPFGQRQIVVQRFPIRRHLQFNFFFANACLTNPFFDPFLCRRFFFRTPIFFNQVALSYPIYYPIYAAQPYVGDEQGYAEKQEQENELTRRIDRLTDEVNKLREEQTSNRESREQAVQPQQAVEAAEPTKILVFRDGRRREIQNYALVGSTLWALTERRAEKIPVSGHRCQ